MSANFKEIGNNLFKEGKYVEALEIYSKGLAISDNTNDENLNFLKNQSACYLKLERYSDVVLSCDKAISICGNDQKSLYRRSLANVHLKNLSEAYSDAKKLIAINPKSNLYISHIQNVDRIVQTHVQANNSFTGKVDTMFQTLLNATDDATVIKCINNLTVLVRENSNSCIWSHANRNVLFKFCDITKPVDIIEAAHRCLSLMVVTSIDRSLELFKTHSPQYFANMIYSPCPDHCRLAGSYLENILSGLTQLKKYKEEKERFEDEQRKSLSRSINLRSYAKYKLDPNVEPYVTECLTTLLKACNNKKLSAAGRDSIIEILLRFVPSKEGINWSRNLLNIEGGIIKILEVGAASHKVEMNDTKRTNISLIDTTTKTKMSVAILLAYVYDDLVSDKEREKFRDICCDFVLDLLSDDIFESKLEAANLIGLFFQGPYEIGNAVLGRSGILEGLLVLINSDVPSYQRIALDAIVMATTKKDKCMGIVKDAVPILENIYRTGSDAMRIRALVGLCKLGVVGGRDSSVQSLADGSNIELAKACKKYLRGDDDMLRWAAEALAFLTLDAEVKEVLVNDKDAIERILAVHPKTGIDCLYPLCTVLLNVTNSYDKPEILPEMLELAKYAQHHIPETHEKDTDLFIKQRINQLMSNGLSTALYRLVQLADSCPAGGQSASKEMIARVYLSAATIESYRGALIQAGGGKALLSLAISGNTETGKMIASQALAKVAITMDPRIAFPGQRSVEVIRPMLNLLHIDNTGLQNFESLMALTNLGSVDDTHRRRIINEQGLSKIEQYMFEEHEMLRRAATECLCNLLQLDECKDRFLNGENDRVKLLVCYCMEVEDVPLIKAASGALAVLSDDKRFNDKMTKINSWFNVVQTLMACGEKELQHRGVHILRNMLSHGNEEFCRFIVQGDMLEVLMALSKMTEIGSENVVKCANDSLNILQRMNLIQPVVNA